MSQVMLAFRDAVIRALTERFSVPAIPQAPLQYDPASAGMVENALQQVKEKVRNLGIATRELLGIVIDAEHVALAWYVCAFCWSDYFPYRERRRRAHCIPTCTSAWVSPTSHACSTGRKKILFLEASKKKVQITDKFLDGVFLGVKEKL